MAGIPIYLLDGGSVLAVELPVAATVADLAEEAARLLAVPCSQLRLSFQGQRLRLDQELSDAGVGPESRVEVSCGEKDNWDAIHQYDESGHELNGDVTFRHSVHGTLVEFARSSNGWWRFMEPCDDACERFMGIMVWNSTAPERRDMQPFEDIESIRTLRAEPGRHPSCDLLQDRGGEDGVVYGLWMGVKSPWGSTWANKRDALRVCFSPTGVQWFFVDTSDPAMVEGEVFEEVCPGYEIQGDGPFRLMSAEETVRLCHRVAELHPALQRFCGTEAESCSSQEEEDEPEDEPEDEREDEREDEQETGDSACGAG
eukprot:TRINITY_DN37409_c0_g2_i1.p1 TRINITY_DN37409_c0_g2~~TRINITY_DN37409_c0_g2_i1.p1  ORF type:complete len:338 (+),score=93.24 TRINITY_DN37409_c0_g2_i1:74-1015(+)